MIQNDPLLLAYVNAKLHDRAPQVGGFLYYFLNACLNADYQNYALIRPALVEIEKKYPADPVRLQAELEDTELSDEQWYAGEGALEQQRRDSAFERAQWKEQTGI